MKILDGTEAQAKASAGEISEALSALQKRGESEALRSRIGCALTVIGVLVSGVLLYLGHYYALGLEGLVVLLIYHYATSLDPELADDPRLRFAIDLTKAMNAHESAQGPIDFWMELNAYDMEVPDERSTVDGGCIRMRWKQSWFRATFDWGGEERILDIRLEALQEQDGIRVTESKETHFLTMQPGGHALESEDTPDANTVIRWLEEPGSPT